MIKKLVGTILSLSIVLGSFGFVGSTTVQAAVPINDIAYGKQVYCSTSVNSNYGAGYAVDGTSNTKWVSQSNDNEWIMVDLGAIYYVSYVGLNWGETYASKYTISWAGTDQVFHDAVTWGQAGSNNSGQQGHMFYNRPVRYIKVQCNIRGDNRGISLYDFKVMGTLAPGQTEPSLSVVGKTNSNVAIGKVATTSSQGREDLLPTNMLDGNMNTQWSSAVTEKADVVIDLEDYYVVNSINLYWGDAFAKQYSVQYSNDGVTWKNAGSYNATIGMPAMCLINNKAMRYIKINLNERSGQFGYNLKEVQVLGYN